VQTLFGYEDQDLNKLTTTYTYSKYFGYSFTIASLNYYAINVKIGLLFVDGYNTRGTFYLSRDNTTSSPVWSWSYNTKGAYGEQLCGTNTMDYVLFANATLPTRNRTS